MHRGHSPYVPETIARMPRTVALVYLGNCGGYTLLDSVFTHAPEAQVITTTGVGTISVNDPFLKTLKTTCYGSRQATGTRSGSARRRAWAGILGLRTMWRPITMPARSSSGPISVSSSISRRRLSVNALSL